MASRISYISKIDGRRNLKKRHWLSNEGKKMEELRKEIIMKALMDVKMVSEKKNARQPMIVHSKRFHKFKGHIMKTLLFKQNMRLCVNAF